MAHKQRTPNSLTQSKWFRFGFSLALSFGLALILLLIPVTAGTVLRIPVPHSAMPLLRSDSTLDLSLPFGASLVRATNGLTITKSAPAFVDQGGTLVYTLTVTNDTGSDLTTATIIDVVPTGATCLNISSPSGPSDPFWTNSCGTNAVWDLLYIPSIPFLATPFSDGTTNVFTYSVTVDEPLPDQFALVNSSYQISDTTPSFFDAGPAVTTTVRAPNWAISKTVSSNTIQPGEFLTYTITISNDGSLATTGDYTVTDVLPTNTNPGSVQIQSPGTLNGSTITWVITESLAVGASKTLTYTIQATTPLTDGETIVNQTYTVTGGNVYSEAVGIPITTTVVSSAALVITKTASVDPVQAGDLLTYTITITNDAATSQGPAFGVIVSDTLPGDVVYQSAGFAGGVTGIITDIGQPTILWELTNPLAVGASAQMTVTVLVTSPLSPGFITNNFAASATNASLVSDTITTEVSSTNTITLSKSVSPGVVAPGDTVTYTITLTNSGNGIAIINLADVLHSDFTPSTFTQSGLSLPGRTPFTTEAITTVVFAATAPITPGTYYNQVVTATYDLTESVISNIAPVQVVSAVITITKVANVSTANIGDTITYTYYITNTGDITLTGITLTDNLLGPVTPLGATTLGSNIGTTGTATTTVVEANLPGPIINTATVTGTYLTTNFVTTTTTESVDITYTTSITVEKIATPSSGPPAQIGDTITYTYRLTNTGTVTLSNIVLNDDKLGSLTVTPSTLGPNQSTTVTGTAVVLESNLPGPLTNTVTVTGTNILTETAVATATASVPLTYTTSITVEKIATPSSGPPAQIGDTITYTYRLTNTGTVTLSNIVLNDDKLGSLTVTPSTLGPNQSATVTGTTVVLEANLPGPLVNTVTVTGTNILAETTVATATASVPLTYTTSITVEKIATPSSGPPAQIGDTITYTYRITNTGAVTLSNIVLNDDKLGSLTVTPSTLGPNQSTTVTGTTVVLEANLPGPLANTVTVTGTNLLTETAVATATASVPLTYTTSITVEKIATPSSGPPAQIGDTITYTYRLTNTGTVTLSNIVLNDDKLGSLTVIPSTLGPNQSTTVTGTTVVSESHLPGPLVNVATVTGTNILAQSDVATATASVPLTYTTDISIDKSANVSTATLDDVIVYTYRITNNSTISLTNVILVDDKLGTITSGVSLPPGAITVITSHTVLPSDFTAFPVTNLVNTAIVSGTDFTTAVVTGTDTVTVTLVYTPQITIAKTTNVAVTKPGEIITYTFYITNTGNVTLTNITLTDDKLGPITVGSPLAPNGGNTTATVTYTVLVGDVPAITNTATVTGDDILGRPITDSTTHVVSVQEVLTAITATNSSPTIVNSTTFFTVTTNLSSGVTYSWNFGDGSSGAGQFPLHTYTTVGTYTAVVTASNGVSLISTTTVVTITPGPVDKFILTATTPQTAGVAFPITITAVDAFGNTVTSLNQTITISDSTGTIVPTTVTLVNGITVTNFTVFSATSPALDTIQAISGTISGTVQVEILPNIPNTLALTVNPTTIRVCQTATATATLTDQFGNRISGQTIDIGEFPVPPAHVAPASASGTSNASGQFAVSLQGISSTASAGILANNAVSGPSVPQALTVLDPAVPSAITVTVSPTSVFTTGTAIVTAEVNSCVGPVNGAVVTFTIPGAFGTVNPLTATTNASGIATATVTAGNTVGTTVITGTVEGPLSDDTPFTILPPVAPVLSLVKTASPASGTTVSPGQTINYQIVVSNSGTAAATNVVITDALDVPNVGFVTGSIIPGGNGPVDTGGGVITFSVSSLGIGATVTATIQVTVTASTSGTVINNRATVDSSETSPLVSNPVVTHQVITSTAGPIFLPIILTNCCLPNLVIDSLTVGAGNPPLVTVVVRNAGNGPTDSGFWVDFYADPSTVPNNLTGGDRRWQLVSSQGIAWPISTILAAGQSITLTSITGFDPNQSKWTTPLPSGSHSFYAFADSFDAEGAPYVEIFESDETDNQAGPVITILAAELEVKPPNSSPLNPAELPPRRDFAK